MLRAEHVWFAYRDAPVLRDVSLAISRGALVGIIGPNGSGKTTLLKLLAGLATPARGRVTLDDRDLRTLPRAVLARQIATVPQETHPAFDYSVLEMALMGRYPYLRVFQVEGPEDLRIARAALASTGTLHLEDRSLATLSGGEKQRVIIASALAQIWGPGTRDSGLGSACGRCDERGITRAPAPSRGAAASGGGAPRALNTADAVGLAPGAPLSRSALQRGSPKLAGVGTPAASEGGQRLAPGSEILLLDEPTASLDLGYQLDVAATMRALNAERGITMVVSTHDLNLAASVCRELVLLRDGQVLATGPTASVLTADTVRRLYDAHADVRWHPDAGHVTVVPLGR